MTSFIENDRSDRSDPITPPTAIELSRPTITVVIPTLNEVHCVVAALASARAPGVETIVVDGGSSDATIAIAEQQGARVIVTQPGRGRQLAAGAAAAHGDYLLFLHADARLPPGYDVDVHRTLVDQKTALGAFRLRIDDLRFGLRVVEWGARQRSRCLSLPYGDQALFLRADTYQAVGGFRSLEVLEDLEFVRRVRRHGRVKTLDAAVLVSARAWRQHGVVGLTLRHAVIVAAYFSRVHPETIARVLMKKRCPHTPTNPRSDPPSDRRSAYFDCRERTVAAGRRSGSARELSRPKTGLLFLCVANSARSQMAEGLARRIAPPGVDVASAGSSPTSVHHLAVRVMRELGIDISTQYSKPVDTIPLTLTCTVVTLCGEEVCPSLPEGVDHVHWPIDDPAAVSGSEEEQLAAFRRARDELRHRIAWHCVGMARSSG